MVKEETIIQLLCLLIYKLLCSEQPTEIIHSFRWLYWKEHYFHSFAKRAFVLVKRVILSLVRYSGAVILKGWRIS